MSEYDFEEERGGLDFDYRDEFEPTEDMINDWNIHNDHQEGSDPSDDEFSPCWQPTCLLEVCTEPEHFALTDAELDAMFTPDVPF